MNRLPTEVRGIERRIAGLIALSRSAPSACWEWRGVIAPDGYGRVPSAARHGLTTAAHRLVYARLVGPIPEGLTLDHLCRNRRCVNPAHLEPVTMRENNLRSNGVGAIAARKTHCNHGHPLSGENLRMVKGKYGPVRDCIECRRRVSREAMQRARDRGEAYTRRAHE